MKKFLFLLVILGILYSSIFAQPYSIQQYLGIRSATSPTLAPDGKKMAFLTNYSGTTQVFVMNFPNGEPHQLTNYNDNISFVRWLPNDKGIIFGKAVDGNENTQLFWMKTDGSDIKKLTNAPTVRHNFGAISADGDKIYYASNKRDKNYFDIYAFDLASGKEEFIYRQDGNNDLAAVNDSGSKFIISRDGTEFSLDNNLYLIDAKTRQETLLTKHFSAAQFGNVHFLADGIIYAHNNNREFYSVMKLGLINAAQKNDWSEFNRKDRILDITNWDVDEIETQPYGNLIAYTLNREGFSELYLRKVETGGKPLITTIDAKSEKVSLPADGVVGGLTFSSDSSKLAFTFSSAKFNTDIWIYDVQSKKLVQATHSSRGDISQNSFVEPNLIKYKTFDGREIPAWYYKPDAIYNTEFVEGVKVNGVKQSIRKINPVSVIVSVHGGPEAQERPTFNPLYQYYLSRGYAILATNVRGSTGYGKTFTHLDDVRKREDAVKDLAFAVEWLKISGGADAKKIAVMGGSYGGYMTLAAITLYPELFAVAVDTVGISNWESFLKNTSGYRRRQREVEYGKLDIDLDFLRSISPLAKVDKIKCPLFVIQGKNDPRVPYTEAEQIVAALKKRGATVQYKLYDDEGHGIAKLKNRLELYPLVADFLDKYLK
jgi:dipeptidyl aminopeptidase/acylaminoacyl peptidase